MTCIVFCLINVLKLPERSPDPFVIFDDSEQYINKYTVFILKREVEDFSTKIKAAT